MPRYFYSELANRPLVGSNVNIVFQRTAIIGSNICGIYASDNRDELAVLDGAISQRAGVIEIGKDEYDQQVAQKKTTHNSLPSSTSNPEPKVAHQPPIQVTARAGVESAGKTEGLKSSEIKAGKVEDPRSVIKVDSVNSPGLVQESERVAPISQPTPKRTKSKKAA